MCRLRLVLAVVVVLPWSAAAADRYVAPLGADTANDCSGPATPCRSINHAIGQAASGDTINLAAGSYREGVRIQVEDAALALTFLGGWNAGFTTRDPTGTPSVIRSAASAIEPFVGKDRTWIIYADDAATIDVAMDGLVITRGVATITPPSLPANYRYRSGGGLLVFAYEHSAVTLSLSNSVITRNKAIDNCGGALFYVYDDATIDATLTNVQITKNSTSGGRGGLWLNVTAVPYSAPASMQVRLVNSLITKNAASGLGGGASFEAFGPDGSFLNVDLVGTTITANKLRTPSVVAPGSWVQGGGGISATGERPVVVNIVDSIVWGSRVSALGADDIFVRQPLAGTNDDYYDVTFNVDHSDVGEVDVGDATWNDLGGNLDVDPGFAKLFHLGPDSPLIDVGTCTGLPATDFEGDPRPSGATCDMGADEVVP